MSLPKQLDQDESGALVPDDVAMLETLEGRAVAQRDYRLASQLRDTLDALTPRAPPPTLAEFAREDPSAALSCFWANGARADRPAGP
eukprot:SAG11_NODE_8230_length_1044_cov_1.414815_1_plen_87_part_00